MPTHCPSCKKAVPPDAEDCPFCPMSFRKAESQSTEHGKRRSRLFFSRLRYLALFAFLAFFFSQLFLGYLKFSGVTFDTPDGKPASSAEKPQDDLAQSKNLEKFLESAPQTLTKALADVSASGGASAKTTIGAAPPELPPEEEPEEERLPKEWRLRGVVYDIATLAPLSGCTLIFSDPSSTARYETMTDGQGRYRMIIEPLPGRGYNVRISHAGYATSYLDSSDAIKEKGAGERKEIAVELARSLDPPRSVRPQDAKPLVTDFFLAPQQAP